MLNIVGGAGRSETYGDRCIQVTDGNVKYSINGGSNGVYSDEGEGVLSGSSLLYVGGNAVIGSVLGDNDNPANFLLYGTEAGCVMGAGNGNSTVETAGQVNSSRIIIDGNAKIKNSVYGGGNFGPIAGVLPAGQQRIVSEYENASTEFFNADGVYMLATNVQSGKALLGNGTTLSSSNFDIYTSAANLDVWKFIRNSNGTYYIQNIISGYYLSANYNYSYNSFLFQVYCNYNYNSFPFEVCCNYNHNSFLFQVCCNYNYFLLGFYIHSLL